MENHRSPVQSHIKTVTAATHSHMHTHARTANSLSAIQTLLQNAQLTHGVQLEMSQMTKQKYRHSNKVYTYI